MRGVVGFSALGAALAYAVITVVLLKEGMMNFFLMAAFAGLVILGSTVAVLAFAGIGRL